MLREVDAIFEAEYTVEIEEPFDSSVVRQKLQDELGFSGIVVTEVFVADGASDL